MYTLNDKNQRTGATLPDGNTWAYTYDVMGQLTGAVKQDTANNPLASMSYLYDLIGNRTSATENNAVTTYTSNLVNQYTLVNAAIPTYDADGNMTGYNGWSFTWNGENRLIVAENTTTGVRVEADYDYMGRRIFKKVYSNNTLTKHSVFAYDGFKQIAEFDALNSNALVANYLWSPVGLDVPLLRNNEYLIADGNKNIIQIRNANGAVTDSYNYDPFGKVTHSGSSENPFRFSSEFHDDETGLVYYNYRYYDAKLGRWLSRDHIGEGGGENLYFIVNNNTISVVDKLGKQGGRTRFAVGSNPVKGNGVDERVARALHFDHVDLFEITMENGKEEKVKLRYGFYGPEEKLKPTNDDYNLTYLSQRKDGRLRWGEGKGKKCDCATEDDIKSCILKAPRIKVKKAGMSANCHTDIFYITIGCCLKGFSPLSLTPLAPHYQDDPEKINRIVHQRMNENIFRYFIPGYEHMKDIVTLEVMSGYHD